MNPIYGYSDYRKYLRDFYAFQKREVPGYSFERFSKAAGIRSPNYLKLVMDGKRDLSLQNVFQFGKALGLDHDELSYFEALAWQNQSGSAEQRTFYSSRLRELRKRKPRQKASIKLGDLVSAWYYPAVIVSLDGCEIATAQARIARQIDIEPFQVAQVILTLEKHGFLEKRGEKYALKSTYFLYHDKKMTNAILRRFLNEQLELSRRTFDEKYGGKSKFFAHTFTISRDRYDYYVDRVNAFLEELTVTSNAEAPQNVVQLNLQLFPMGN